MVGGILPGKFRGASCRSLCPLSSLSTQRDLFSGQSAIKYRSDRLTILMDLLHVDGKLPGQIISHFCRLITVN